MPATREPVRKTPPRAPATAPQQVETQPAPRDPEIERILGLTVPLSVILAEREMSIETIIAFSVGTIVEFNVPFDSPLTLYVANTPIAQGEAVKVGENFGLRITQVDTLAHRIGAMGAR